MTTTSSSSVPEKEYAAVLNFLSWFSEVTMDPGLLARFKERIDWLTEGSLQSPIVNATRHESTLVEWGLPLELSIRFCGPRPPELRFTVEPAVHMTVEDREACVMSLAMRALVRSGQPGAGRALGRIWRVLRPAGETPADIIWLIHVSATLVENTGIRLYFAPVRVACGHNNVVSEKVDKGGFRMTVRERVHKVFDVCGMKDEIPLFEDVYSALAQDHTVGDRFITFLGVDFRRDQPPSVKVYFNPQPDHASGE